MNKTLNTLAIAAAACLAVGSTAQAGSMGYPQGYSSSDFDNSGVITERRVVRQQPTYVTRDQEGFGERVVKFPFRAARTAVRTPVIVGETVAGRRAVVSDEGFLAPDTDGRRLSSRRLDWDNRLERGVVRTGRTVVRTPRIIGETATGRREVMTSEGRPFYYER